MALFDKRFDYLLVGFIRPEAATATPTTPDIRPIKQIGSAVISRNSPKPPKLMIKRLSRGGLVRLRRHLEHALQDLIAFV